MGILGVKRFIEIFLRYCSVVKIAMKTISYRHRADSGGRAGKQRCVDKEVDNSRPPKAALRHGRICALDTIV